MAEFVEFRAEEWIPELEQMERIHLFEPKEVKSIATKRKEFEYKIQRRTKCKEDFLKYIQFEVDLHRIIKARRKKTGIHTKKAEIDHSQTHRIANLFKQVIFKFQNDIKLWMSFFKFCQDVKFHSLVSQMLIKMLQVHADKPELWIFAANWEFEKCKSVNNARQFLTKGLRHHPSSELLFEELFKLELEHIRQKVRGIEKNQKEDENYVPDEVTCSIIEGKVADVVYESATKAIEGVEFKVRLLNILMEKRGPRNLQDKIFQDIVKNHLDSELTWNTIAEMEFKGFQYNLKQIMGEEEMEVDENEKMTVKDRIQKSINIYEESVKKINTMKMWSFYLDFVIKLNENVKSLPVFKTKLLNNAMEGALASGNMDEKYYIEWSKKLLDAGNKNQKLREVLKKGTEEHPKSLTLWHACLKFHLSNGQEVIGMEIFNKAVDLLDDAAPVWSLSGIGESKKTKVREALRERLRDLGQYSRVVKYLRSKSSPKLEEVLQNGIKRGGEIAETLKPPYIEWLVQSKGIEEARKVFESPEMNLPPCLNLYKKMAEVELNQTQPNLNKVRRCLELACNNFGQSDSSVWLDYIRFELENGDKSRITKIHLRAMKCLHPSAVDEFVTEFNNFKILM